MQDKKMKWDKHKDLTYTLILVTLGANAIDPKNNREAALNLQKKPPQEVPKYAKPEIRLPKIIKNRPKHESIHNSAYRSAARMGRR